MSANFGLADALISFAEGVVGDAKTEALVLAVAVGYATRFTNAESVLDFLATSGEPKPTDSLQAVLQGYFSRLDATLAACAEAAAAASDAGGGGCFHVGSALRARAIFAKRGAVRIYSKGSVGDRHRGGGLAKRCAGVEASSWQ